MPRNSKVEAEQTRLRILDTAMREVSTRGYARTNLEQIARNAGVTRGAIYGHFDNKVELYQQLMRFSQEPIYALIREVRDCRQAPLRSLRRFMNDWLALLTTDQRHRDSFEILLNKTELTEELSGLIEREQQLTQDVIDALAAIMARAINQGELPTSLGDRQAGVAAYAYLMGLTQTWLFNPSLFPLGAWREALTEYFIQGLVAGTPQINHNAPA
jgi:TetR/AcrR family acrAB operon transcriptional repressor